MMFAIIDSGVQAGAFEEYYLEQYCIQDTEVFGEEAVDYGGHGTGVLGVIKQIGLKPEAILSIRPQIKNGRASIEDILAGISFAVEKNADIINISMGTGICIQRDRLEDACEEAWSRGSIIVCSASNQGGFIYPWACEYVLKVSQGQERKEEFQIGYGAFANREIKVNKNFFSTVDISGNTSLTMGNSAAAAYLSGMLGNIIKKQGLKNNPQHVIKIFAADCLQPGNTKYGEIFTRVMTLKGKLEFIHKKFPHMRCLAVPYGKEIESLIRYQEYTDVEIVGILNDSKFGNMQKKTRSYLEGKGIRIADISSENDIPEADCIIIGYLDKVSQINKDYTLSGILEYAIIKKMNIYSFAPISPQIVKKFRKHGLQAWSTIQIDRKVLKEAEQKVPFALPPDKPVLGIFGTSSKQGKFTLQMNLRECFVKKGITLSVLSTEHQSELMNVSFCYPFGYGAQNNILLTMEECIDLLKRLIYYIDQTESTDFIMVGGQSWLLPHSVTRQTCIYNMAFLDAVKPDYAVLVINPEIDHEQYVRDTMNCLASVFKCKVIAIAFSDKMTVAKKNITYKLKRTVRNIEQVSKELSVKYEVTTGCINDAVFIESIAGRFVQEVV